MRKNIFAKTVATASMAAVVACCGLALAGCNDKPAEPAAPQTQEQDNCYGDDMPVIAGADEQDNCYGGDMPVVNANA